MIRKTRTLIILMSCVIGGCSAIEIGTPEASTHVGMAKEIGPYLSDFVELSIKKGFPEVKKAKLTGAILKIVAFEHVGVCYYFSSGDREIEIDSTYWQAASEIRKRALVYHELAHCLCNRHHNHRNGDYRESKREEDPQSDWGAEDFEKNGYFQDHCATSLMHPRMQSDKCVKDHFNYYMDELFEGCRP